MNVTARWATGSLEGVGIDPDDPAHPLYVAVYMTTGPAAGRTVIVELGRDDAVWLADALADAQRLYDGLVGDRP